MRMNKKTYSLQSGDNEHVKGSLMAKNLRSGGGEKKRVTLLRKIRVKVAPLDLPSPKMIIECHWF